MYTVYGFDCILWISLNPAQVLILTVHSQTNNQMFTLTGLRLVMTHSLCTGCTNCLGSLPSFSKPDNDIAVLRWPTSATAIKKSSQQKRKAHGKKEKLTEKKKSSRQKRKALGNKEKLTAKEKSSQKKRKAHGKRENLTAKKKSSRRKLKTRGGCKNSRRM